MRERRPEANVSPFLLETWIWLMPSMLYSIGSSIVKTFYSSENISAIEA